MRIDKFLWVVRLAKTRSVASRLCAADHIKLNNTFAKSSKLVCVGDTFGIKVNPIWRTFKIIDIPKSRVGAKLVSTLIIEITKAEDLDILKQVQEINRTNKYLGVKGRPTKKDRRDIDDFTTE